MNPLLAISIILALYFSGVIASLFLIKFVNYMDAGHSCDQANPEWAAATWLCFAVLACFVLVGLLQQLAMSRFGEFVGNLFSLPGKALAAYDRWADKFCKYKRS